jgi:hypothetical protein
VQQVIEVSVQIGQMLNNSRGDRYKYIEDESHACQYGKETRYM